MKLGEKTLANSQRCLSSIPPILHKVITVMLVTIVKELVISCLLIFPSNLNQS